MGKRFTDTDKWKDKWYRKLGSQKRDFWQYLLDHCDNAGFWKKDFEMASFVLGFDVENSGYIQAFNSEKTRINDHGSHLEIVDFISFQFGVLKHECKPHRPIIELLKKYNLKGYRKGINTLEEKEKEKDKEKEKEIKGGVGGGEIEKDFNQLEAFNAIWELYPVRGRLKRSASLRWWCESVMWQKTATRIVKALDNYLAHLKANDWKKPKDLLNWLEEWPEWEDYEQPLEEWQEKALEDLKHGKR